MGGTGTWNAGAVASSSTLTATTSVIATATAAKVGYDQGGTGTTLAVDATQAVDISYSYGLIFVSETNAAGASALIAVNNGTAAIVWQSGTAFSTTADTPNKTNVYVTGGNLTFQNKNVATIILNCFTVRTHS
jgi:hypothetical protein